MSLFLEILIAAAVCFAIFCMAFAVQSLSEPSAPRKGGGTVYTVIAADENTTNLQDTVASALRLKKSGALRSQIIIVDIGMDDNAKRIARIMANDSDAITVCPPEDLPSYIVN